MTEVKVISVRSSILPILRRASKAERALWLIIATTLIGMIGCAELNGEHALAGHASSPGDGKRSDLLEPANASVRQCDQLLKSANGGLRAHNGPVLSLLPFTEPQSGKVGAVSVSGKGEIGVWNLSSGTGSLIGDAHGEVSFASIDPACRYLALVQSGTVKIVPLSSKEGRSRTAPDFQGRVTALDFDPTGSSLYFASSAGPIYRWRFEEAPTMSAREKREGRELERYIGHSAVASAVAAHSFGRVFFSGDWDGRLIGWLPYSADDTAGGKYDTDESHGNKFSDKATKMVAPRKLGSPIDKLEVTLDGARLFVASREGALEVWKVRGFSKIGEFAVFRGLIKDFAIDAHGEKGAAVGRGGVVKIFKVESTPDNKLTFTVVKDLTLTGAVSAVFSSKGTVLVGTQEGRVLEIVI